MLSSIPVLWIVTTIMGFLAGLGVGGGSLLLLWLTLVMDVDYPVARSINLLFFIPGAIISTVIRRKQGSIHGKIVLPAIIFGCIATALISLIASNWDTRILKRIFGILLLFTGIQELGTGFRKKQGGSSVLSE